MTLYDRFRLYALNPNKISVVRGRVVNRTWEIADTLSWCIHMRML
jgi:hypothetical protein